MLNGRSVELSTAKVFVCFDSVLCLGKIVQYPRSVTSWKGKIEWFAQSPEYRELDRIDGGSVVFEWKFIFPGHTTLQLLQETLRTMLKFSLKSLKIESSSFDVQRH